MVIQDTRRVPHVKYLEKAEEKILSKLVYMWRWDTGCCKKSDFMKLLEAFKRLNAGKCKDWLVLVHLFRVSWKFQASCVNQADPGKDEMAVGVEAGLWRGAALLLWREAQTLVGSAVLPHLERHRRFL